MATTRFARVEVRAQRKGKCETCGKRWTKTKTFWHSVNPFNRRDDGTPKTRAEVLQDVRTEADSWNPEPHCPATSAPQP